MFIRRMIFLQLGIASLISAVVAGQFIASELPLGHTPATSERVPLDLTLSREPATSRMVAQGPVLQPKESEERPSLFDGIRRIIGDSPVFDDNDATEGLVESLNEAEKAFKEIRESNRDAIRGMNRQIRIGRAKQSPHIVLVTLPRLRFDQLPAMTRLNGVCTSGTTFTNYYAPADTLLASRWSLFSGKLATQSIDNGKVNREESLAEVMWKSGYQTTMVGTWASSQHPVEIGYEHWTGFPSSSGVVDRYPEFFFTQSTRAKILGEDSSNPLSSSHLMTDEVTSYLRRHRQDSQQFYLHVGLPFVKGVSSAENIQQADLAIGRIVDSINTLGLGGRVCLLIVGETSHRLSAEVNRELPVVNQKLTYSQSGLNEGNMRTPLIVFWGGHAPRGVVSEFPCTGIDILPTLTSLAHSSKTPSWIAGTSLVKAIQGQTLNLERILYWRMQDGGQAARRGRWKVIVPPHTNTIQLYDLESDPQEVHDVAAEYPGIVKSFVVDSTPKKQAESATL